MSKKKNKLSAKRALEKQQQRELERKREKRNKLIHEILVISLVCVCIASIIIGLVFLTRFIENKDKTSQNNNSNANQNNQGSSSSEEQEFEATHEAVITIEDYGEITLELYGKLAPATVTNFVKLARQGYYNGSSFHRIIDGFMMQGGGKRATDVGTPPSIRGEFAANGFNNPLKHTAGVISMARATGYNSATSEFFIVDEDSPHLNGQYAGFGRVLEGMDIVHEICDETPIIEGSDGSVAVEDRPIITSIVVRTLSSSSSGSSESAEGEDSDEGSDAEGGASNTTESEQGAESGESADSDESTENESGDSIDSNEGAGEGTGSSGQ